MTGLDPAFLPSSQALGDLALCHLRLQDDTRFPWIVMIPGVVGAQALEDLSADQQRQLLAEILSVSAAVRALGEALGRAAPKINIGQLGNVTAQLHVHVVGRRPDDAAWPGPVWGHGSSISYGAEERAVALAAAREALGL